MIRCWKGKEETGEGFGTAVSAERGEEDKEVAWEGPKG